MITVDNDTSGTALANLTCQSRQLNQSGDNIRPETVIATGVHPKERFGTFLRALERVSFGKLHEIRKFYQLAFGKDVIRLFDSIDDGYIEALAAFRNVIIHCGSKADEKFVEQVKRFPELRHIKIGDEVILDGVLVKAAH